MKFFVVSCCLLVGASAIHEEVIKAKWSSFKVQHGKEYHPSEESTRLNNFLQATIEIEQHNARFHRGEVGYAVGHNRFSDLSNEEINANFLGKISMSLEGFNFTDAPPMAGARPDAVDWRTSNIVSPAKDQDQCGSCYAFGTLGVVESAIAQKTGRILDLSEQQVVDCTYGQNNGCDGGHEVKVMNYVASYGLVTEAEYPYTSGRTEVHSTCKKRSGGTYGKGMKFVRHPRLDEEAIADAVAAHGTLVASISGENTDFQRYTVGIYDNPTCPKRVDHVISIIGYGTEGGRKYWLVKNSWGTDWGKDGFGKVLRGVNQCGIVSDFAYSITV